MKLGKLMGQARGLVEFRRSRRTFLGGSAAVVLLAACGRSSDNQALGNDGPVVAPVQGVNVSTDSGDSAAAIATHVSPAAPATATVQMAAPTVAIMATAVPTGLAVAESAAPSPTDAPADPTTVPTHAPTATAVPPTATPEPTQTPIPTATPFVFDAERLTDVLATAVTNYAGSFPPRLHNVELAAARLDETRVAPGEVYSFNENLGPATLDDGYQIGFGITTVDGQAKTIPSVAGGICQVATTLFHAVYWAGLEVVKRSHHRYWIPRYGQPPSGRTGFDATVDPPGLDFQFRNTTEDWIIVRTSTDGESLLFKLIGVDPGWSVESTKPALTNFVAADPTLVREEDPTFDVGREIYVEHAEDGFDVYVERTLIKDGEVIDTYAFKNHYVPSRNVLLVGVKGKAPTPVVAAEPTVDPAQATPTPAPVEALPTAVPAEPTAVPAEPTAIPTPLPDEYVQGDGDIRVPYVVGMAEGDARALIESVGLANTYTNYQGPDQVPADVLNVVPVGHVLSQSPADGSVPPGTVVYLAVRKE